VSKSYGDPSRRPECKSATIEFIAPQEYMLRPPQPAVYLFLLDVSRATLESGYLRAACDALIDELDKLPGDGRTQVGFITFHRTLQFYQLPEGAAHITQLIVGDVDDVFLPSPTDLLANLSNCREQVVNMLSELPELFQRQPGDRQLPRGGAAGRLKMGNPTGGRVTVVQGSLPSTGPGKVANREATAGEKSEMVALLNPSTDFYKKLALDCTGQQVAVDLFVIASQHCDLATIGGIARFSSGQVQTFPGYHTHHNPPQAERFDRALRRYVTREVL
jgi:protein transport protein SEC24